jgi:hypothetical protein
METSEIIVEQFGFSLVKFEWSPSLFVQKENELATLYALEKNSLEMQAWIKKTGWEEVSKFMWLLRMLGLSGETSNE